MRKLMILLLSLLAASSGKGQGIVIYDRWTHSSVVNPYTLERAIDEVSYISSINRMVGCVTHDAIPRSVHYLPTRHSIRLHNEFVTPFIVGRSVDDTRSNAAVSDSCRMVDVAYRYIFSADGKKYKERKQTVAIHYGRSVERPNLSTTTFTLNDIQENYLVKARYLTYRYFDVILQRDVVGKIDLRGLKESLNQNK